jgi:hypothetical protein
MNTILITLLVVVGLLALAFLGLAIQVMFKSDHKFPNMHIGGNKNMLSRGITCAQSWDKIEQKNAKKIPYEGLHLSSDQ